MPRTRSRISNGVAGVEGGGRRGSGGGRVGGRRKGNRKYRSFVTPLCIRGVVYSNDHVAK